MIAQIAPDDFLLIGFDTRVDFCPLRSDSLRYAQGALSEEGKCVNGKWTRTRILNGDQTFFGVNLNHSGGVVRVKLTRYRSVSAQLMFLELESRMTR